MHIGREVRRYEVNDVPSVPKRDIEPQQAPASPQPVEVPKEPVRT